MPVLLPVFLNLFDGVVDLGNGEGSVIGVHHDAFAYARIDVSDGGGSPSLTVTLRGNPDYAAGANDPDDVVDLFSFSMP